jgi:dihydrofolate synthase / folylpolyglutamate synthase
VDVALVEVGLGGRLDATNAWDGGVAVLTNVDLDHTELLGDTVAAIAREKAAIIKRGDVAVTGTGGEALAVVRRRCTRLGVPLEVVGPAPLLGWDRDGLTVELPRLGAARIGLRGRHQAANAAVANALLDALERAGIASAGPDARRDGYAQARWPGRLELLAVPHHGDDRRPVDVLLDGAHNAAGAATLAVALEDLGPHLTHAPDARPGPLTVVWASMADKDIDAIVTTLAGSPALAEATVIATAIDAPRALSAADLAARWRALAPGVTVVVEPDPGRAVDRALETARGPVVVAGSLYLVGAARARLVDDPLLRDPLPAEPGMPA